MSAELDQLKEIVRGVVLERGQQYSGSYGRFKQLEVDETLWTALRPLIPLDIMPGVESALRLATHKFCRVLVNALEGREDYDSLRDLGGYALLAVCIKNATIPEQLP